MTTDTRDNDECGWCGDYRRQHHSNGCRVCSASRLPWTRGVYACRGFVEVTK